MKTRCYAKYSYVIWFVLAGIMLIFSLGPLLIWTDETMAFNMIWSISMFSFCVFFCISGIHHMQFYCFEDGCLIVKSAFGEIVKLDTNSSIAYIETLPTYSSWIVSLDEKWICIYDKSIANNVLYRFKSGCANKKKQKKVQIIYSEDNESLIGQHMLIQKKKCSWDDSTNYPY